MSDAEDRKAIADAATTVEGITAHPTFKQVSRAGEALVSWGGSVRASNGFGFMNTWSVMVLTPQGLAAADKWADGHLDALLAALGGELTVTKATPTTLTLDAGSVPCVLIEGTRPRR